MAFERLKEFKDLELFYDSVAALVMVVKTDVVAVNTVQGQLATAATLNFPLSAGRTTYTLPLDGVYGTLVQFIASSTGVVKLYGGVLRARNIGVYFNGANGEIWTSQPMGLGIG